MAEDDFSKLKRLIEQYIESVIDDKMLRDWAEIIRDTIYKRTKSGKGLTTDKLDVGEASLKRLEKLTSKAYKELRARKVLGPYGKPMFSNLTFTGEMLESMRVKKSGNGYIVEIPDDKRNEGKLTNSQVAFYVSENGRPFFGIAKEELKRIENQIKRQIRQKLRSRR